MCLLSQQQRPSTAMAQLPNGERARIPMEKFTDDCLNPDHPGEVGVRLELLGTMCRRKQALQRHGHCFRHLVDFLEDVLGTWGVVPRELVAAQRAPRILPRCETLTRPLPGAQGRSGVRCGRSSGGVQPLGGATAFCLGWASCSTARRKGFCPLGRYEH